MAKSKKDNSKKKKSNKDNYYYVVLRRPEGPLGGLSLARTDMPVKIGKRWAYTALGLFHSFRFTSEPRLQAKLLNATSVRAIKLFLKSDAFKDKARPDWGMIHLDVMKWVLKARLMQYPEETMRCLRAIGSRFLVENSCKDEFFGGTLNSKGVVGCNRLRYLWMELQPLAFEGKATPISELMPLNIQEFRLRGKEVPTLYPLPTPVEPPFYTRILDSAGCLPPPDRFVLAC